MKKKKQPYEKPRITSGKVFEQASLACNLVNQMGGCRTGKSACSAMVKATDCGGSS